MPDHVTDTERHRAAHRSTMVSVVVNIVLSTAQLIIGVMAQSQALVADAIHSFSDLVSDGVVLIANKHSARGPDPGHPYGHHRFETAASLVIGALLIAVGIGMLWRSAASLQEPGAIPQVHSIAIVIAFITLVAKELLFRYQLAIGKRYRSTLLIANAWHSRSDAISSLVVVIGIGCNLAGFTLADPVAALIVGLFIIRMGWKFFISAFNDLVDAAADAETEHRIRTHLLGTPGVLGIHAFRTRKMGDFIWVEVDLEMDGSLTIEQGHAIAAEARQRVMVHEPVLEVTTHFDPVTIPKCKKQ